MLRKFLQMAAELIHAGLGVHPGSRFSPFLSRVSAILV